MSLNSQDCCDEFFWGGAGDKFKDWIKDAVKDCLKECHDDFVGSIGNRGDPVSCMKQCIDEKCGNADALAAAEEAERFFQCCYGTCDSNPDFDDPDDCEKGDDSGE